MSNVTNLVLLPGLQDQPIDDEVMPWMHFIEARLTDLSQENPWLHPVRLARVDQHAVGPKAMESEVWIAAFNHFGLSQIRELLNAAPWIDPENVRYLVMEQEDDAFILHTIGEEGKP